LRSDKILNLLLAFRRHGSKQKSLDVLPLRTTKLMCCAYCRSLGLRHILTFAIATAKTSHTPVTLGMIFE